MRRLLTLGLAGAAMVALLAASAAAHSDSQLRLRGTVALKDASSHIVTLRAARQAAALRVPGSLAAIRIGQRVELRGSTLRSRGDGSRVLARNVSIASSSTLAAPFTPQRDDDEVELEGTITSLVPLTVASASRSVTCSLPVGMSLRGFAIGDAVEMTCDLKGGSWVLRTIHLEDDDGRRGDDDERGGQHDDDVDREHEDDDDEDDEEDEDDDRDDDDDD